jgi:hypothetical protein
MSKINRKYYKTINKYKKLKDVPEDHITRDFCIFAVLYNHVNFNYVNKDYLDYDFYLKIVEKSGICLCYVPEKMKTDEIIKKAFKNNPDCLYHVPKNKITYKMCLIAVKHNSTCLFYVPNNYKTKELCILSMHLCGCNSEKYIHKIIPKKLLKLKFYFIVLKKFKNKDKYYIDRLAKTLNELCNHNDNSKKKLIKNMSYYYF